MTERRPYTLSYMQIKLISRLANSFIKLGQSLGLKKVELDRKEILDKARRKTGQIIK